MKINYNLDEIKPFIINDYENDFVMGEKDNSEEKDSSSCQIIVVRRLLEAKFWFSNRLQIINLAKFFNSYFL